ncbi:transcription factor bHLH91-like [Juglans microcarpa x Juglans regia]|uniref:transcription factor bHLH91-like n=1 Tax=Juglans microcarpa x Juglans regia TaxID=2249226 RepID=UPI001B7DCB93|nr:transcription factor bHLH91-like [Juglans microcarpa x Juglans regia]XP_040991135.1 transcription factor bHLH91-like [Juglans microcarpa x Juglans regia]
MYEETGCFDPNPMSEDAVAVAVAVAEDGFSQTVPNCTHNSFEDNLRLSMEELSYQHHNRNQTSIHDQDAAAAAAMEIELQQHLAFNMDSSYNGHIHSNTHLVDSSYGVHEMQEMDPFNHHHHHQDQQQLQHIDIQNGHQSYDYSSLPNSPYPPTPDLLNLFHLPRCSATSLPPNSSISFSNPGQKTTASYQSSHLGDIPTGEDSASGASVLYDPLFHLNLPPQPPLFRQLFGQSLPNGYSLPGSRNGSLFGTGGDEREGNEGVYQDGDVRQFENGVLEFSRDMGCIRKGRDGETKHLTTERERRQSWNDKYNALRSLVPNPTKTDRASVVGDAIEYIKELLRTVNELKLLVEKKRCGRERGKRQKTEGEDAAGDVENYNTKHVGDSHDGQSYNGSLRSSWLQRKSKDTEVDVRIIDDEVTIKLVQRKNNCLLFVSKALDELQLDLHHVAGGQCGDFYSFLFNTKIYEGSSVYASSIANKLIEVVDRQCCAAMNINQPTSSY